MKATPIILTLILLFHLTACDSSCPPGSFVHETGRCISLDAGPTDCVDGSSACSCEEGATAPCGSDEGACQSGVRTCRSGRWSETCDGEVAAGIETCNGIDDDCDTRTDEG